MFRSHAIPPVPRLHLGRAGTSERPSRSTRIGLALSTAAVAMLASLAASPVHAQADDACGPLGSDGSVRCSPEANPYPNGIAYSSPPSGPDLTVVLDDGVRVRPDPTGGAAAGVALTGSGASAVTLDSEGDVRVRTTGAGQAGVEILAGLGHVTVTAPTIVTTRKDSAGLSILTHGGDIEATAGDVRTDGARSPGIQLRAPDGGDITLTVNGSVRTSGFAARGIDVDATGTAAVTGGGDVRTEGDLSTAVLVQAGDGDAVIDLARVSAAGNGASGAVATTLNGSARITLEDAETWSQAVRSVSASSTYADAAVTTSGTVVARGDGATAVDILAGRVADVTVGDVLATGFGGRAIGAEGNTVRITVEGSAATRQDGREGAFDATVTAFGSADPDANGGDVFVTNSGRIVSHGAGVDALSAHADGELSVGGTGVYRTSGDGSFGLRLASGGAATLDIADVGTRGAGATGIDLTSGGPATVRLGQVKTSGAAAGGVRVSAAGDIDFTAAKIVTRGDSAAGVVLDGTAEGATVRAQAGSIRTRGNNAIGLDLSGAAGAGFSVDVDSVATRGAQAPAIRVNLDGGGDHLVSIRAGTVTTHGRASDGILLTGSDGGTATIDADNVATHRAGSIGIHADVPNMDLRVTSGSVTATGKQTAGIYLVGRNLSLESAGPVRQVGDRGAGIFMSADGALDFLARDTVSSTGDHAAGISLSSIDPGSTITVNASAPISASGYFAEGIAIDTRGSIDARLGDLAVDSGDAEAPLVANAGFLVANGAIHASVGNVTADGYTLQALTARSRGGDLDLTVNGTITTSMSGGVSAAADIGAVTLRLNDMNVRGFNSNAVLALGGSANLVLNGAIDDHSIIASASGTPAPSVLVNVFEDAVVDAHGTIDTYEDGIQGIRFAAGGNLDLSGAGTIHTRGGSADAMILAIAGNASVRQAAIVTEGESAAGISGSSDGDLSLALGSLSTSGLFASGVNVTVGGKAEIQIGSVSTSGAFSSGVSLFSAGDLRAAIDSATTLGGRATAVDLSSNGNVDVTAGTISTQGTGALGLRLSGADVGLSLDHLSTRGRGAIGILALADDDLKIDAGEISTSGATGIAISGEAGGNASVRADQVSTTGSAARAVLLTTGGNASLNLGSVSTSGAGANAVDLTTGGDAELSVANLAVSGEGAGGIGIQAGGKALVRTTGMVTGSADQPTPDSSAVDPVSPSSDAATAIVSILAADNAEIVNSGSISTSGALEGGIAVQAMNGVHVSGAGSVATIGEGATGIYAAAGLGSVAIEQTNVSTTGSAAKALFVAAGGNASLNLGSVATTGVGSDAADLTTGGDGELTVANLSVSGEGARGIAIQAGGKALVRTTGMVTGSADQPAPETEAADAGSPATDPATAIVSVLAADSAEIVNSGSISTSGALEGGIAVQAMNGVHVSGAGSVATIGEGATSIYAAAVSGPVAIEQANVSTTGSAAKAVFVTTRGDARLNLGSVSTSGAGSDAVDLTTGGDAELTVANLSVSGANAHGVGMQAGGNALVRVTGMITGSADQPMPASEAVAPGDPTPDAATAIVSVFAQGRGEVVNSGSIRTSGSLEGGIALQAMNGAHVSGAGSVATIGEGATGIYAAAASGAAVIEQANVSTTGNSARGAWARSYGTAAISVGNVTTSGSDSIAVLAEGADAARVQAGSILTSGSQSHGVVAHSYGTAGVTADSVVVTGAGARGIDAASYGRGDATVIAKDVRALDGQGVAAFAMDGSARVDLGSIVQAGDGYGVAVFGSAGANARFDSVLSSGADTWAGVSARASAGNVVVSGGSVSASGLQRDAIDAVSAAGDVTVLLDGRVSADGGDAAAVFADARGGIVTLRLQDASARAGSIGTLVARGDRVLVQAGTVRATGSRAGAGSLAAIEATARNGDAGVTIGAVLATGAGLDGVALSASGTGSVTVQSGGLVQASHDALVLRSGTGATVFNGGTILGGDGAAIRASGGGVAIDNAGSIRGGLVLTEQADTLLNRGEWRLAGETAFGGGDDRVTNAGVLVLSTDMAFGTGNDAFANQGTLALGGNPGAGGIRALAVGAAAPVTRSITGLERFTNTGTIDLRNGVAGDVLTISGDYAGSGASTLALDIGGGDRPVADRLVVGGAATGSTTVYLSDLGMPAGLQPGVVVVQAGTGSSAGAFTLAPAQRNAGLLARGLVFDAATGSFSLVTAPSTTSYKLVKLGEGAQSLWFETADSISAHLAAQRDAGGSARGFWMSAVGAVADRHEHRSFTSFGYAQTTDLGYRQDVFGSQFGADFGGPRFGLGITGGYASSNQKFDGGSDRASFDAWNIGAYADFASGTFFANALAKFDRYSVRTVLGSVGQRARTSGQGFGGRVEAGLRLGSERLYAEPVIGIAYLGVRLDPLAFSANLAPTDRNGGRATAGLRLGSSVDFSRAKVTFYAQGDYVRPFDGEGGLRVTTGGASVVVDDRTMVDHAAGKLGATITSGPVTGFLEGDGRFGRGYRGGGGRAGIRIRF